MCYATLSTVFTSNYSLRGFFVLFPKSFPWFHLNSVACYITLKVEMNWKWNEHNLPWF